MFAAFNLTFVISSSSARMRPIIFAISSMRDNDAVSKVPTSFPFRKTVILSEIRKSVQ